MKKTYIIFLIFLISGTGCVSSRTNFKGMEPYAKPIENKNYVRVGDADLQASSFRLLWFFPVTPEPDISQVIDRTIVQSGGDNLIEMKMWHQRQYWILGTVDVIYVSGKIIRYE